MFKPRKKINVKEHHHSRHIRPHVVSIPNSLDQSQRGNYYVGQTPKMNITNKLAYGALYNPSQSERNLYVNVFTITNFYKSPILAEIWLGATPIPFGQPSPKVANTNQTLTPTPKSKIQLLHKAGSGTVREGINVFDRIVPPQSTVVAEEDGKYIIPPGEYFILTLKALSKGNSSSAIAFGWFINPLLYVRRLKQADTP
jgi:hypothetical protein